jgi:TetR/AcrR family transcriptional regulator, transcriptional repressor for nem operon
MPDTHHQSEIKLLRAAIDVVRAKGYNAARVDDICATAGVTKGSFFHHFRSKEDLILAAAAYWDETSRALFADAAYHGHADPLARVLGYIDFRIALIRGEPDAFSCFSGTMVQDVFATHPAIRDACRSSMFGHARMLEADIRAARREYAPDAPWTAASLALHMQAVVQGAFVLAKAEHGTRAALASLDHLRRYVVLLFGTTA